MADALFIGVDLGTSFIKAGVYDANGMLRANAAEPVCDERPAPGIFIQRGDMLYESVCRCIAKAARSLGNGAKDVRGIAFTGQMAGSMGVDENWGDITGWSCSLDSRYLPWAEEQRERFGDDLFLIGCTNAPVMCAKYAWFRDSFPEEHKRIAKYVMLGGYMIGRLSGVPVEDAVIDNSLITWTGLADLRKRQWSEKLCGEMGVELRHMSRIVDCTTVGGYLRENAAKQLGLPSGIPLVVGAGDKISGCTGAGILHHGDMIFEAASYGAISCVVPDVRLDPVKRNYDIIGTVDQSAYCAHKYLQGSGIATRRFIDEFCGGASDPDAAFAEAEKKAKELPPGSGGMLAIGLLGGSAMPFDSEMKGLFIGHGFSSGKGHFYRSLLEGFSYDLALTLESISGFYPEYADKAIRLIGGGARSAVWPQMLADVTGHVFETLNRDDVALRGAALLAAAGTGEQADLSAAASRGLEITVRYEPDPAAYDRYRPYVALYERVSREMHETYEALNRLSRV